MITAHEIRLAILLIEPRIADLPNTLAVLRQYVNEREAKRDSTEVTYTCATCTACGRDLFGKCNDCMEDRTS